MAANSVNGIDAKSAPNRPEIMKSVQNQRENWCSITNCTERVILPRMEKKIMKPAEIWITLLLPILVDPRRPTFSLFPAN
jgi:hypothetical protein